MKISRRNRVKDLKAVMRVSYFIRKLLSLDPARAQVTACRKAESDRRQCMT
jgi:hypothetical protein